MTKPPRILIPVPNAGARLTDADIAWLVWIAIIGILEGVSLLKEMVVPRYFFFDASTIDTFIAAHSGFVPADSYSSTAAVFGAMGFRRYSPMLPVLSSLVVIPSLLWGILSTGRKAIRLRELAVFGFFSSMAVVYMTTLSKDLIVLLLVLFFMLRPNRCRWPHMILWIGLAFLYGYYFRSYWFLIVPMFVSLRTFFLRVRRPILIAPAILFVLFIVAAALHMKFGLNADSFRTVVNDARLDSGETNARTMITPFIPGGGFVTGYANVCLTLAALIVPAPLLVIVSPYYFAIFLFVVGLQVGFWLSFRNAVRNGTDVFAIECGCLVASFLAIQSMFEPDYGSYMRHLSPFYPVMFCVWLREPARVAEVIWPSPGLPHINARSSAMQGAVAR